ncbi:MAG: hypothetical protein R3D27_06475 [Hyphomicrobiaceae bacterium]
MAAEPALKPTTAIRSLGYSNPSIIRRLRDKFNAEAEVLIAEARRDLGLDIAEQSSRPERVGAPAAGTSRRPTQPREPEPRHSLLRLAHAAKLTSAEPTPTVEPAAAPRASNEIGPMSPSADAAPPLGTAPSAEITLVEIGFRAAAVAMRQHLSICAQVAHIPAVAAFIRQQMFLTELMLGVGLPSPQPTSTRH